MPNVIIKSASKIVLVGFSVTIYIAFLAVVSSNLDNENIAMAVVALFSSALSSVMTYYFSRRANKKDDPII